MGMRHGLSLTGWSETSGFLDHARAIVEARPTHRTAMVLTGLTPVLEDVSQAVHEDLRVMLPISLVLVVVSLLLLHRDMRIVAICGLPIVLSLAITFGSIVVLDMARTPMTIATGPILRAGGRPRAAAHEPHRGVAHRRARRGHSLT